MTQITKMHTLGNDFVIFCLDDSPNPSSAWIQQLADRKLGVGCDQVLGYRHIQDQEASFQYRIFNADGSEVGQCGNGALCLSRYLFGHHAKDLSTLTLRTHTHNMQAKKNQSHISINLGTPDFTPSALPMDTVQADQYQLQNHGQAYGFHALSLGNPHAVIRLEDIHAVNLDAIGACFNQHPMFPDGVNVGIMQPLGRCEIQLRVYERGVGETTACGSGACAAAITAISHFGLQAPVNVGLPGGKLTVDWQAGGQVWLSGPTTHVFSAHVSLGS